MENFAAVPTPRATEKSFFVTYLKHSLMAELQTQGFDIDLSEEIAQGNYCLLYTSDDADDRLLVLISVVAGG